MMHKIDFEIGERNGETAMRQVLCDFGRYY